MSNPRMLWWNSWLVDNFIIKWKVEMDLYSPLNSSQKRNFEKRWKHRFKLEKRNLNLDKLGLRCLFTLFTLFGLSIVYKNFGSLDNNWRGVLVNINLWCKGSSWWKLRLMLKLFEFDFFFMLTYRRKK